MSWPDTARCFSETLAAELARHQTSVAAEPGEPRAAGFSPVSQAALEFTEVLRAALAAEPEAGDGAPAAATFSPVSQAALEFTRVLWHGLAAGPEAGDGSPAAAKQPGTAGEPGTAGTAGEPGTVSLFAEVLRQRLDQAGAAANGPAQTAEQSWWITATCPVCRHSFRQGEKVWLEDRGGQVKAVHDEAELPCHAGGAPREEPPVLTPPVAVFLDTFRQAYPALAGVAVKRLKPGHPLLAGQYRERATCAGCNHTFRPFERVAFCPCRDAPETCRLPAHRDPAASLLCFDALADPSRKHCPMDYHKLGGRADG